MKTSYIIQMTGMSIFSVSFLSPLPQQHRDIPQQTKYKNTLVTTSSSCPTTNAYDLHESVRPRSNDIKSDIKPTEDGYGQTPEAKPTTTKPPQTTAPVGALNKKNATNNSTSNTNLPEPGTPYDATAGTSQTDTVISDEILVYRTADDSLETANNNPTIKKDITGGREPEIPAPRFFLDEVIAGEATEKTNKPVAIITTAKEAGINAYPEDLLLARIHKLNEVVAKQRCSDEYAFIINLGLRSGKKRFLIIDLKQKTIVTSGLVAHGRGKEKFTLNKKYSNTNGSSCSSLGLYRLGASYTGSFGKSFRLTGLEKTNSNAMSRAIVLHSMSCIPDEEIDFPICQSEGCPSVSPSFFKILTEKITASKRPILLWVFDPLTE